jgi:hypothetical protein
MPDPRCLKRLHDWGARGPVEGATCVRSGCGKVFGKRPARATAVVVHAVVPAASRPVALAEQVPTQGATVSPRPAGLAGAAARLARSRGLVVAGDSSVAAVASEAAAPVPPPGAAAEPEPQRESLSDWLLPSVPGLVADGCAWSIRKAGREPLGADPVWEQRWEKSYKDSLGHYVPRLEMHPAVALLIATFFLWLSMWWGAPKIKKDEPVAEVKPESSVKPVDGASDKATEAKEVKVCLTPATVPNHAGSPASAGDSGGLAESLGLTSACVPMGASMDDGSATNVVPNA